MAGDTRRDADTASLILDVAERLVQVRGFNGFSYADIASELGVTKAALHYHFRGKAELGEALVDRYAGRFEVALAALDGRDAHVLTMLEGYVELYERVLRDGRMCLCGMLAAEFDTLPEPMQSRVVRFFDENAAWLARLLERGRSAGALRFGGASDELARTIVSSLEGAMLVTRPYGDISRFVAMAKRLVVDLCGAGLDAPAG